MNIAFMLVAALEPEESADDFLFHHETQMGFVTTGLRGIPQKSFERNSREAGKILLGELSNIVRKRRCGRETV